MPKPAKASTSSAEGPAVQFQLFNEIGIINQLVSTEFERVLPHGLTQAQFAVLNHCVRLGDNRTPADLASAFQVTRGTMTTTLKRLSAKAFIEIVPDDADGRSKRVLLTKAGRTAREEAIAASFPLLVQTQNALNASEVKTLLPILQKLRFWLDENRSA